MTAALTQIFYTISAALLIPTELGLLVALFAACWGVGTTLREGLSRRSELLKRQELETLWSSGKDVDALEARTRLRATNAAQMSGTLTALAALSEKIDDEAFVEKTVAELRFENIGVSKAKANASEPQGGVFLFFKPKIRHIFIRTDVKCANYHSLTTH